jgi:hypothetical protein
VELIQFFKQVLDVGKNSQIYKKHKKKVKKLMELFIEE